MDQINKYVNLDDEDDDMEDEDTLPINKEYIDGVLKNYQTIITNSVNQKSGTFMGNLAKNSFSSFSPMVL